MANLFVHSSLVSIQGQAFSVILPSVSDRLSVLPFALATHGRQSNVLFFVYHIFLVRNPSTTEKRALYVAIAHLNCLANAFDFFLFFLLSVALYFFLFFFLIRVAIAFIPIYPLHHHRCSTECVDLAIVWDAIQNNDNGYRSSWP